VRIDRTIPLWGLLTMLLVAGGSAVTSYFEQRQTSEAVREIKVDMKTITTLHGQLLVKDAAHGAELRELRRRVEMLEQRR